MAIAALVCGIASATFSTLFTWIFSLFAFPWFAIIGLITGIVGIVLSILASKECKMRRMPVNGMVIAGLVCSIIGVAFGLIGSITCIICPCICACRAASAANDFLDIANDMSRYYY